MARQERPVDPAAGPLQSLAYDLRKLRVEGGGPTYREPARKTGYSASTLSEAASGNRKPTLDVLLAFVGALHGDQQAWQERWASLADTETDTPPTQPTPSKRKKPPRVVIAATLAVIIVVAAGAFGLTRHKGSTRPAAAGCPAAQKGATFSARTYGSGTTIRQGPARADRPLASVPAGCTIGLVGYCLGEAITDATAYTPDVRWFMVAGGGVIASAMVHGNPPAGMGLSRCPGDRPAPSAITLSVVDLRACPAGGASRLNAAQRTAAGQIAASTRWPSEPQPQATHLLFQVYDWLPYTTKPPYSMHSPGAVR